MSVHKQTLIKDHIMQPMKFYVDTHDVENETFPAGLTPEQFEGFFAEYQSVIRLSQLSSEYRNLTLE